MDIKQLEKKFKPETRAGLPYRILGFEPNDTRPLAIATNRMGSGWDVRYIFESGRVDNDTINQYDLMPILPDINYLNLPEDVLCAVSSIAANGNESISKLRYSTGTGQFFDSGCDSRTGDRHHASFWNNVRIVDNPKRPSSVVGLKELPDNVTVELTFPASYAVPPQKDLIQNINNDQKAQAIYYQIMAEGS